MSIAYQVNANQIPIPTLYGLTTSYPVPSAPTGGVSNNGHVDPTQLPIDVVKTTPTFAPGVVTGGVVSGGVTTGTVTGPNGTVSTGVVIPIDVGATLTTAVAQLKSLNPMVWLLVGLVGLVILKKH